MAEEYTNLSHIKSSGRIISDEEVDAPIVRASTVVADEMKKNDGKEYALKEYAESLVANKTEKETTTTGGISRISNAVGDEGGCLTFSHNDQSKSGIGVNNGGKSGISAQIYSIDENKSGTRINVTQQKIYYTKKSDATYSDGDEIATMKDIGSGGSAEWGKIQGTMANQKDLNDKLTAIDATATGIDAKVNAEVARATNKENEISASIDTKVATETTRATNKETEIASSVATETARAVAKENEISSSISSKVEREIASANGKAIIFNEQDGGGAKFEHIDGTHSFVGVNDGGASGIGVQLYAVSKDDATQGVKLNVEKSRITYVKNKATSLRTEDDELATKGDVKSLGGTFRGNFATKALLLAYTGPKEENDYAIVDKDETQVPPGDCWRYRYSKSEGVWKAEYKVREQDVIKLLGNEAGSGEPYHFTYFYSATPSPTGIKVGIETITLDNTRTLKHYEMDIGQMDGVNAGLYTKALADAKADKATVDNHEMEIQKLSKQKADKSEIPTQYLKDAVATADLLTITKKDGTQVQFRGGSGDDCIKLLGNEPGSGQPYHFPFNINPIVQNADSISTTFDTLTLDNNKTKTSYPISIPSASIAENKAGLYNKALSDLKADKEYVDEGLGLKLDRSAIMDNLESPQTDYALSARMGKELNEIKLSIDAKVTNAEIDAMFAEW